LPSWEELVSGNFPFDFDEYLTLKKTKFLDVGSGPFSTCGLRTSKTQLDFQAADPLAHIYKALKIKNKIFTGVTPEFALVERLVEKYGVNEFDLVHISNALDHSYNPLIGIIQMLSVCKIGGKVILNHAQNEAQRESYTGFHQWNICVENSEFIVWRQNIKYNISKILEKYADVIICSNKPLSVKVLLTKKKDIFLSSTIRNRLASILNEKIFEKLAMFIIQDVYTWKEVWFRKIKQKIRKIPFCGGILKKVYRRLKYNIK
jgi:hypothetical protein